ncbi:hypothetical protein DPMN_001600 [Dreissena polymorpha]|uniref:Uncharacterized protein n=1 Tax=Dreissena polymorpha TaxID=45954 RepID=A0A9D4RQZ6_DREPO|nr:hypothetical protein DPMN_001600 [Dreissena polymorpha]
MMMVMKKEKMMLMLQLLLSLLLLTMMRTMIVLKKCYLSYQGYRLCHWGCHNGFPSGKKPDLPVHRLRIQR